MPSNIETNRQPASPPDGGYGWVVVTASFFIFFFSHGIMYSLSCIFDALIEEFGCSKSEVTLVASLAFGLTSLFGPVVSLIQRRFSARLTAIAGVFILFLAFMSSAFAPTSFFLYLSFGISGGIGMAMIYLPLTAIASVYFLKKRSKAIALITVGTCVGLFAFPYVIRYLIAVYGWRGALFVLAAIELNALPPTLLLLPLEEVINSEDFADLPIMDSDDMDQKEIQSKLALQTLTAQNLYHNSSEAVGFNDSVASYDKNSACKNIDEPSKLSSANITESQLEKLAMSLKTSRDTDKIYFEPAMTQRSISMIESSANARFVLNLSTEVSEHSELESVYRKSDNAVSLMERSTPYPPTTSRLHHSKASLFQSPLSRGNSVISNGTLKSGSSIFATDIYAVSLASQLCLHKFIETAAKAEQVQQCAKNGEKKPLHEKSRGTGKSGLEKVTRQKGWQKFAVMYLKHFKNARFSALFIAHFIKGIVLFAPTLFLIGYCNSVNLEPSRTTFLMSLIGAGQIVGRPAVAICGDIFHEHKIVLFSILMAISGLFTLSINFVSNFYFLIFFVIQFSVSTGGTQILAVPIASDLVRNDEIVFVIGLLYLSEGIATFSGPPLLALLPSDLVIFSTSGLMMLFNALVMISVADLCKLKTWKRRCCHEFAQDANNA